MTKVHWCAAFLLEFSPLQGCPNIESVDMGFQTSKVEVSEDWFADRSSNCWSSTCCVLYWHGICRWRLGLRVYYHESQDLFCKRRTQHPFLLL